MSEETQEKNEENTSIKHLIPTELPEDIEVTQDLQEWYDGLAEDGYARKDIVREILREDIDTPPEALAKLTGLPIQKIWQIKGPAARWRKSHRPEPETPPETSTERLPTPEIKRPKESPYKSGADINEILYDILKSHPDIKTGQITEIMSWAKMTKGGLHPAHLYSLLLSFKGVNSRIASMLSQKYSLAVSKAQQEQQVMGQQLMPGFGGWTGQAQPQQQPGFFGAYGGIPQLQRWPRAGGMQQSMQTPQGYYSKEQVDNLLKEQKRSTELETLKDTVKRLRDDIPRLIKENVSQTGEQNYEVIEMPVDAQGNPCSPADAVTIKKVTRAVSATSKEDFLDKLVKMKQAGLLGKDVSEDTIRKVIREEGKPATTPEMAELKTKLDNQERRYDELKDQMTAEDRKRMEATMNDLKNQINSLNTRLQSSGVNSPEGVMATAITEAGKHKPVEQIVSGVERILTTGPQVQPPPEGQMPAGPEQRGGVLKELRQHGLVTTVRERVRGK